jgi:DNA-binding transcriptional LysR family regulator
VPEVVPGLSRTGAALGAMTGASIRASASESLPPLPAPPFSTDSLPYLLDAKLIRCFLAVFDLRNVSLAADALCLTQSATSKCILKLEDQLGVPLFERGKEGMIPTTFGLALCKYARQIDLESRYARAEISALKARGYGAITIGIGPMWSVEVLPDAIASFHRARPGMHVRVSGGVPDTLVPDLIRGNLDLICAMMEFQDHPQIEKTNLFDVELVVVARSDHPLHRLPVVHPADLRHYAWVRFTDGQLGNRLISEYFVRSGLEPPECAVEVAALSAVFSLLRTGDFIAALSSTVLPHAKLLGLQRVKGVQVDRGAWQYRAGIAFRRDSPHPMIGEFIEHLRVAAGLQPGSR